MRAASHYAPKLPRVNARIAGRRPYRHLAPRATGLCASHDTPAVPDDVGVTVQPASSASAKASSTSFFGCLGLAAIPNPRYDISGIRQLHISRSRAGTSGSTQGDHCGRHQGQGHRWVDFGHQTSSRHWMGACRQRRCGIHCRGDPQAPKPNSRTGAECRGGQDAPTRRNARLSFTWNYLFSAVAPRMINECSGHDLSLAFTSLLSSTGQGDFSR